jgi:hypothetical protein
LRYILQFHLFIYCNDWVGRWRPINAKPFGLAEGLLLVQLMEIFGFGIKNEILEKILFSVAPGVYSSISPF